MRSFKTFFILIFLAGFIFSCAKRGTPTGGPKDTIPPLLINASPKNKSIEFKSREISLSFDEYIKLNDLDQQLIISPPLNLSELTIDPQTTISKKINIEFSDSLKLEEKTTYTFNFGSSIEDNNEGNILSFFSYTISTGKIIDSLFIKGKVSDAYDQETERFVSLYLYPIDSTHSDSMIYLKKPLYVTNTLDTILYNFQNLREDKYQIIAIKDYGKNYFYDQGVDKIGFVSDTVNLPGDTLFNFRLFKEDFNFRWERPQYVNDHHIRFPYYGIPEKNPIKLITPIPKKFKTLITKEKNKDTLNFWFPEIEADSLQFELKTKDTMIKTNVVFYRPELDSFYITPVQNNFFELNDTLRFNSSLPLSKLNSKFISLQNKDSVKIPFELSINKNKDLANLFFKTEPNDKYDIKLLPEAFIDFWGNTNDTIKLKLTTKSLDSYGIINIQLNWKIKKQKFILEIINDKNEVSKSIVKSNSMDLYKFENLIPGNYKVRLIFDKNDNQKWDSGNYLKKIQPEKVIYLAEEIELRENWEVNQVFILK